MGKPGPGTKLQHGVVGQGVLYSPDREPARLAAVLAPANLRILKENLLAAMGGHPLADRLQDFILVSDHLGKPHLHADGGAPGPAVSFSWAAGAWWAALGTPRSWIGLDAASPGEFAGGYPLAKVFRTAEWQAAASLTGGDREAAAALLWSVKEAVVKARGCGYHFFGPRQIRVEFAGLGEQGPRWRARLAGPLPERLSPPSPGIFPAASVRLDQVWLTVAWMTPAAPDEAAVPAG